MKGERRACVLRMYSWRAYRRRYSACARTTNTACAFVCVYGRNEDQSEGLASRPVRKPAKKPHLEEAGFRLVESNARERRTTQSDVRARTALFSTPPRAACMLALLGAQGCTVEKHLPSQAAPGRGRWEPCAVRERPVPISRAAARPPSKGPTGRARRRGGESATRVGGRAASRPLSIA